MRHLTIHSSFIYFGTKCLNLLPVQVCYLYDEIIV